MKVNILQQDLLPVLNSVSRSSGVRTSLPVLANILIQTEGAKLKLSATNLEIGVVKRVNAKVLEPGEISVPARTLVETISSLSGEISLEAELDQLKISTSKFKAVINGISASEFPLIPLSSENQVLVDSKILSSSLPKITFASAVDEGRPVLTGILTEIKNNELILVATDGFRLAHQKVALTSEETLKVLIPRRTFEEVVKLIDEELKSKEQEKITISSSENQNQIIFKIGLSELSSRLIEGQFPAWEKIIPLKFKNRTVIDRNEFLKAVKLASIFAKDAANIVKIQTSKNSLKLSSETKELGFQETELEAEVEGEEIIIAFNSKFLIDALSATSSSQITIEFSGNLSAALIKPIGEEVEYIIMPVRLS